MKIAVVCANGRTGRLITNEAVSRGFDVTAIARGENKTEAEKFISKDLFDLTSEDLKDFDAVIDAFGTWSEDTMPLHSASLAHLCGILSGKETRLLVVGGAGSLYVDPEHTMTLMETADFPDAFKPVAYAQGKAFEELKERNDVKWTYVSPAADFQAEGEKTGKYIISGEELTLNSKGESVISYADYAAAMIDEATNGGHIGKRISIVSQ